MARYVKKYPDAFSIICPKCGHKHEYLRGSKSGMTYFLRGESCPCLLPQKNGRI